MVHQIGELLIVCFCPGFGYLPLLLSSSPLSGPKDLLSGASESTERQGGPRAPEAAPPRLSTPDAQIISNARGKYPQLEIVSFPHSPRKQRISGPHAFTR